MSDIGQRMKMRRKMAGMSQTDLGRLVGVSKVAVSQWENGDTQPNGENLLKMAQALECPPEWILSGIGNPSEAIVDGAMRLKGMIPVISEVQAGSWSDIKEFFLDSDALEWIVSTRKFSKYAFGLQIVGDSMYCPGNPKSLSEGEIAIVEPDAQANHRDVIVARLDTTNKATVKQLVIDGDEQILNPLNDRYKPIQIDRNVILVGVVMDVIRRFR
jgi:SOS-response transcriptional repressor LexA